MSGIARYRLITGVICFCSLLGLVSNKLHAQLNVKDSTISMHLIMGQYAFQIPAGDMSERFGVNSMIGGAYMYKTQKNWTFGIDGRFMFGNDVKDSDKIFDNIETSDGNIVDMEGIYSTYHFYERGFALLAKTGKVFTLDKPNPNSGILTGLGVGYLQHKIFIDHRDKTAPQITGDYLKGYDELKNGPAINVFGGFIHFDNKRVINFYAGLDVTVAFTQDVRPYSFAKMEYNDGNFTDIIFSVNVGWIFPIYKRAPKDFYYY
jgi:hypothetical protein